MFRVGGEMIPTVTSTRLWNRATYRLGYYTGVDYINADGNKYKVHAFTLGFGFNIKKWTSYDNQSTFVNTAIEFGKRGSNANNITENFFKLSVGFLSQIYGLQDASMNKLNLHNTILRQPFYRAAFLYAVAKIVCRR